MRKIFIMMAVAAIALCAVSCTKEGVYKPGKQISKIVVYGAEGNPYPYETWHWNGNRLDSIVYDWTANRYAEKFTYDGKRLVASEYAQNHCNYFYEGNKLVKIVCESSDPMYTTNAEVFHFTHTGKKITGIVHELDVLVEFKANPMAVSPLRTILPDCVCQQIMNDEIRDIEMARKSGAKLEIKMTRHYTLTWEGDNVTKIECVCPVEEVVNPASAFEQVIDLTYDNMHNPKQSLYGYYNIEVSSDNKCFSPNNILTSKSVTVYNGSGAIVEDITNDYVYDEDGYPIAYDYYKISGNNRLKSHFEIEYVK